MIQIKQLSENKKNLLKKNYLIKKKHNWNFLEDGHGIKMKVLGKKITWQLLNTQKKGMPPLRHNNKIMKDISQEIGLGDKDIIGKI